MQAWPTSADARRASGRTLPEGAVGRGRNYCRPFEDMAEGRPGATLMAPVSLADYPRRRSGPGEVSGYFTGTDQSIPASSRESRSSSGLLGSYLEVM